MSQVADILIIGAGAAGLSVAANLAGDAKVVVLEAEDAPCFHSTGRSAAVYLKSYGPAGVRGATSASEAFFLEAGGETPILSPRGQLMLQYDDAPDDLSPLVALGTGVESISVAEALRLVPVLRREGLIAAGYEEIALDIDVDLLMGAFRRMMRAGQIDVATGAKVSALRRAGGAWRVETANGFFEAPIVVNAAGAWASEVAALAGASQIHVQPKRRSAAIVPLQDGIDCAGWPLFDDTSERWYAKPQSGKLMVSPADADPVEACDIHPDDMVLAEGLHRFSERVDIDVRRVERAWAGLRSFSPDGEPVVGFDPAAEGFFWLAGQGGYGIQTAPALGRLAADLVLGRVRDEEWADAMTPTRFK